MLVIVGTVTCFVIGWQSSETRKAASAAEASAEAALTQAKLQAIAMKQWVEVKVVNAYDPKWFRSPVYPYGLKVGNFIEIRLQANNRTAYPLTFKRAEVRIVETGSLEEFIFSYENDIRLVPGDSMSSRVELLINITLGAAAHAKYKAQGRIQFILGGIIDFTPAIGPMEVQSFGVWAEPRRNAGAELPVAFTMTQQNGKSSVPAS